jgi:hypothetical protein
MKKSILFAILFLFSPILRGQNALAEKCDYALLYKQGKQAAQDSLFDKALLCFNSARRCNPSKGKEIDEAINGVLQGIQKQKKTAVNESMRANFQTQQAKSKELAVQALLELAKTNAKLLEFSKTHEGVVPDKAYSKALRMAYLAYKIAPTTEAHNAIIKIVFSKAEQYQDEKEPYDGGRKYLGETVNVPTIYYRGSKHILKKNEDGYTCLEDLNGKSYGCVIGEIFCFNRDSSRILTYFPKGYADSFSQKSNDEDSTRLQDWQGKVYGAIKGKFTGFNMDSTLIYFDNDNYTSFFNWQGQITNVYKGKITSFDPNGKHIVVKTPPEYMGDEDVLKNYFLYNSFKEFMQKEVPEITPEERKLYNIDF